MGPSMLFANGKSRSKRTKCLQGTLRRGLVGACPVEGSFLEKSYCVLLIAKWSGLVCVDPSQAACPRWKGCPHHHPSPLFPCQGIIARIHSLQVTMSLFGHPLQWFQSFSFRVQYFTDLKQSSLGSPGVVSHSTPVWSGEEAKGLGVQSGFYNHFCH